MKDQMFMIVTSESEPLVNNHIKQGWRITMMAAMGGDGGTGYKFRGMLVLEREVGEALRG